jgi:ATP-dependent helicase/nuclease subunit A
LLRLAQEFAATFAGRKRADGVLDFHDLEQFALQLLWDFPDDQPTAVAESWRKKLRFIFVDEYQDINAAQDKIIAALSHDGANANRFLVGDVKQSIYRFRLADPKIFRDYARDWRSAHGQVIPLAENFRSREGLLNFVNSVFEPLMREELGGVNYDAEAALKFGSPQSRVVLSAAKHSKPRVELLLRMKEKTGDISEDGNGDLANLDETTKEARLVAQHLKKLIAGQHEIWDEDHFRSAQFGDMAVLLRSPRGKSETYAKEFERAGVPLAVARGGFYDSSEILDLLSLLQLLDNPLQDVPCIAVLRSPLVGLSLDELAQIRLVTGGHFWKALNSIQNSKFKIQNEAAEKIRKFLERFSRWRKLARQASLSECLEVVLAETLYADWLRAQERGAQRAANLERFLNLAEAFDQFQRQGLFRFLKFIEAQREIEAEPEVPAMATENAVRLMSIHQSKGLEFPVVVLPDLAKKFNEQDQHSEIIFDEEFGLCPKVKPPHTGRRYPSLPHWLAQRHQRRELRGEELRLLYVALTRARDTLVLSATLTEKKWETLWTKPEPVTVQKIARAKSFADWLGLWFAQNAAGADATGGETPWLRWRRVDDTELDGDSVRSRPDDGAQIGNWKSETGNKPEPPHVGYYEDREAMDKLRKRLEWGYLFKAATERKAKSSVTELRGAAEETDDEAEQVFPQPQSTPKRPRKKMSAADFGTAHHKLLQQVALDKTGDLAAEAERLMRENYLSPDERMVLDLPALAAFWDSELGKKIRVNVENVRRELPFTARFSPAEIAEITGAKTEAGLDDDFVVVQGVADLVVLLPDEIWLVDFKTDRIGQDGLPEKIKTYKPQLKIYAAALERIFLRPVTLRALHFLDARRTVEI